jgi:hypothetical protein
VTHVLVSSGPGDPTAKVAGLTGRTRPSLARVPWGNGELFVYGPPSATGPGVSPVTSPIDYDPRAESSASRR